MQSLLAAPRENLDPAQLQRALALRGGGTFRFGIDVFDLTGVRTGERLPWTAGEVTWAYRPPSETAGQDAAVTDTRRRFTAALSGVASAVNLSARRLQPYTELRLPDRAWARFNHGLFEAQNPGLADDGVLVTQQINCLDKSARWAAKTLGQPVVVSGATVVVDYVKTSLTAVFGETRFAIAASTATLGQSRTFEGTTSYLDFYTALLEGISYDQLTADEEGRPASQPMSVLAGKGAETTYGARQGKVLTAGQVDPLLPTLPNVLRFSARQGPSLGNVDGNGLTFRRNESTGPASILARGGGLQAEVEQTISVDVDSQTALEAVADAEAQRYFAGGGQRWQGKVALNPLAGERDVIALRLPRLGLTTGLWLVTEWKLRMTPMTDQAGALMDLTAERRVA